jgi:hypothetical protein
MTKKLPPDELEARRATHRKPGVKKGRQAGNSTTSPQAIAARERQDKALGLRRAGLTLSRIADEIGYANPGSAHRAIIAALKQELPDATRDEYRKQELDRLDRLQAAHWSAALAPGPYADKSARIVLACINMRSKLLGLEAPAQVDVKVRRGELLHVEVLDMLDAATLKALEPLQDEMIRLTDSRAGAIEGTVSESS